MTERHVGVGHGRLVADAVARGSRVRARALGPDAERTSGVRVREAAAAAPDRVNVERRHPDGKSGHFSLRRRLGHTAENKTHVGAGTTHVEGDRVRMTARRRDRRPGPHSACRA